MAEKEQSFQNHARVDPPFVAFGLIGVILLIGTIVELVRHPAWSSAAHVVGVLWIMVVQVKARTYSLKVQDRVIRLEERLRLTQRLPESTRSRIAELSERQLIALRFASDGELAGLAQQALDGKWDGKQIKQAVKHWRADHWRV